MNVMMFNVTFVKFATDTEFLIREDRALSPTTTSCTRLRTEHFVDFDLAHATENRTLRRLRLRLRSRARG